MMKLIRLESTTDATIGVLMVDGKVQCFTLELPWRDNQRNVSCIPPGSYTAERIVSKRFGETILLHGVPNRSEILIHTGNTVIDSRGCILPGKSVGEMKGMRAVLSSGMAMAELLKAVRDKPEVLSEFVVISI